jgi:hypothetical protein
MAVGTINNRTATGLRALLVEQQEQETSWTST